MLLKRQIQKKAISFLSLISCSINKLKSRMFSTCKNFYAFLFYMEKNFCSRKCWRTLSLWPWSSINSSCKTLLSHGKVELLLFDDSKLSAIDNNLILKVSIKYIMTTNRFSVPLFWYCFLSFTLNIYILFFFPPASTPFRLFFHCCIWESSEICACALFFCLFFGYLFVKYFWFIFCLVQL